MGLTFARASTFTFTLGVGSCCHNCVAMRETDTFNLHLPFGMIGPWICCGQCAEISVKPFFAAIAHSDTVWCKLFLDVDQLLDATCS